MTLDLQVRLSKLDGLPDPTPHKLGVLQPTLATVSVKAEAVEGSTVTPVRWSKATGAERQTLRTGGDANCCGPDAD